MSELIDVLLPSDQSEGTSHVRAWFKSIGESVSENEPLLEIETDKVTVEVPSPCSGVLAEVLAPAESAVDPGAVLGRIERGAAERGAAKRGAAERGASAPGSASAAIVAPSAAIAAPQAAHAASAEPGTGAAQRSGLRAATTPSLSPAVRRLLAERRLSADAIAGSGEGGRITIDDVLRHAGDAATTAGRESPSPAAGAAAIAAATTDSASGAPDAPSSRRVPHSRVRRQIAAHMVESLLRAAPHVTTLFEVDLAAVLAHRARHRAEYEQRGTPLSLTVYFLAACVDALKAVPELNARWTDDALEYYDRIDVGVATALADGGLVVPVIRDLGALDLAGIARELADKVTRARTQRLAPADVRGGTFTISNHGVSGSLLAAPIVINQGQSGILGIGKLERRAVVVEEGGRELVSPRPRCYVTLTIDHRVLDGARANYFLQVLVQRLERWENPAA